MDDEPNARLSVAPSAIGISITIGPVWFVRNAISSWVALILVSSKVVLPATGGLLKLRMSVVTPRLISKHDKPIFLQPWVLMPISPAILIQTPTVQGSAETYDLAFACI